MCLRELTDIEVMEYLDGNLSAERRAEVEARLAYDPDARELMDQYQSLYLSLEDDCCREYSLEFVDRVMEALPPAPPRRFGLGFKANLALVVFGLLFVNLLAYIIDIKPVLATLSQIPMPDISGLMLKVTTLLAPLSELGKLGELAPILCFIILVSLTYRIMDRHLLQPETHRN